MILETELNVYQIPEIKINSEICYITNSGYVIEMDNNIFTSNPKKQLNTDVNIQTTDKITEDLIRLKSIANELYLYVMSLININNFFIYRCKNLNRETRKK